MLPESRERGYKPGRFSFNVKGGRCEACEGDGMKRIEMNFLPDVYVLCESVAGLVTIAKHSQSNTKASRLLALLDTTVEEALPFSKTFRKFSKSYRHCLTSALDTSKLVSPPPRYRVARPSVSSWQKSYPNAQLAGQFTFLTNQLPDYISRMCINSSTSCSALSPWATQSWSSSTIWM